jgi:uncharacterized protein (TIGR00661 family)
MAKKIFITPLDWGLGHATRCIPIIRLLLSSGHEVIIGGSGASLELLKAEFPTLSHVHLPAYNPEYPKGNTMAWKMSQQIPKFLKAIQNEHRDVERVVLEKNIDLVISDNRYGCWSSHVTSVFVTHQSNIMMPKRFGWLSGLVKRINESFIGKFDVVWIPDFPGEDSLAGELISFGKNSFGKKVQFIGRLSRFSGGMSREKEYEIVAICSGPEPQRTVLEKIFRDQLIGSGKVFLIIRGVIQTAEEEVFPEGSRIVNFLSGQKMEEAILEGELVLSRSGYSTVMDLTALAKKAIFIPTPGQTEQEYLAARLKKKGIAYFSEQDKFNLPDALKESQNYRGFSGRAAVDLLTPAVAKMINSLSDYSKPSL